MIYELYEAFLRSSGICTDTRAIEENNMFVALKGPSFNANDFVLDALKSGCSYAIADEPRKEFESHSNIFITSNALTTLQKLAAHHRSRLKIPIIGLTGSNGKTTTKELLREALSTQYKCFATHGNLNNHIGVPLSILSITRHHEIAIIEMGANHRKEIHDLCEIARPNYGLITNIGLAHLEGFGGEEGVFLGKKELFDFIIANESVAFLNMDDPKVVRAYSSDKAVTFGENQDALFRGRWSMKDDFLSMSWWRSDDQTEHHIQTQLSGSYNFSNVLASIAIARYFGVPIPKLSKAISNYSPTNNRSQIMKTSRGNKVIVDCYNANPTSMSASILNLSQNSNQPTLAILGDMMELGLEAHEKHMDVLNQCSEVGLEHVILIGPNFQKTNSTYPTFETFEDAAIFLKKDPPSGYTILLKGSRSLTLEKLLDLL